MDSVRNLFLKYCQQGLPASEAAKLVQAQTGMNARTGKPLKKKREPYNNAYNKGNEYLGQYG